MKQSKQSATDVSRYDQILKDVKAVSKDVGISFAPKDQQERHQALARILYDDGEKGGKATRKTLRGMLLALSLEG